MRRKRRTGGGGGGGRKGKGQEEGSFSLSKCGGNKISILPPPPIPTSYFLHLFRYKVLVTMQDDKNLDLHLSKCVVLSFLLTNSS